MALNSGVTVKYLGHSTFLFTSARGTRVLIDPWLEHNPACPAGDKSLPGLDLMLITHGHSDHMQDAVALAGKFKPQVVCNFEISLWLGKQGVTRITGMNKGGTTRFQDVSVTMVNAYHSSSIMDGDKVVYGGEPAGFVMEFGDNLRVYHAGDTCLFGDMKLIGELYQPHLVMLPIGDLFTMDPRQAAYACRLLSATKVIPMHYGTFPVLTGTPQELAQMTREQGVEVIALKPGESLT
jgi:L-ascorbate metabolism protein UlaG (beta-lactamase superfamily)